jgi:prevent-host-death family protein
MVQARVSVRELKSRLSHYLRLARAGESVVITDRGTPIGRIVPLGQRPGERLGERPGERLDGRLAALTAAGHALWSGRKLLPAKPVARVRGQVRGPSVRGQVRGRRSVAALLVADRE